MRPVVQIQPPPPPPPLRETSHTVVWYNNKKELTSREMTAAPCSSRSTATECPPELAAEAEVVLQCGPKKLVFVSKLIAEDQGVNIQFVYSYVYNQEAYLSDGALEFIDQFAPLYTYNSQKQNALHLRPDRNTLTTFHLSHTHR